MNKPSTLKPIQIRARWQYGWQILLAVLSISMAHSAVVLSTLDLNNSFENPVTANTGYGAQQFLAQSFRSGTSFLIVESILLQMGDAMDTPESQLMVSLYTSNSGKPETPLADFFLTGVNPPTTAGIYQFDLSTPVTLSASVDYWIVLTTTSTQGAYVLMQSDEEGPAPTTATNGWALQGYDSVAYSVSSPANWTTYDGYPEGFAIIAVPEPRAIHLLALGLVIIATGLRAVHSARRRVAA